MDEKTLGILEFPKVLERLAGYAAFGISAERALAVRPSRIMQEVKLRQARTSQGRLVLSLNSDISIGGARDIRTQIDLASHAGMLESHELLEIKNTMIAARDLARALEHHAAVIPDLTLLASGLPPPPGLVEAISRTISERGEVLDQASEELAHIRRDLKTSHDHLLGRLERIINDPKHIPMLQDVLITQRNGRYVIPLRAEFKGRIRAIVHDQSSSGATLFIEPLVVVDLNNQWHELQLAERDEIRRILVELSAQIGRNASSLNQMLEAQAEIDLALMCAKYAEDLQAAEPVIVPCQPRRGHPGMTIQLTQARHPLLPADRVVPIDVELDEKTFSVIITGPNTGGKTVTLKTVGLLALMAQSGLHIPARSGSSLSLFDNIFADIGDEQSIEQSLSTFSGHITNIVRILRRAGPSTLVLLDELGAGTDPQEGAALARALLAALVERQVPCLVATHYPELKAFAHSVPGMVNASMEFDLQTLRPTYHLTIGLPGRSNALLIAERLGLPAGILQAARGMIDPADLRAEDLLDEIHNQRELSRQAHSQADRSRNEAEKLRYELVKKLEGIEDERIKILETARKQSQEEVEELRLELEQLRRELQRGRQPLEALKPLLEKVEILETKVEKPVERRSHTRKPLHPLRVGERVRLRSLQVEGIVTSLGESELEVQIGSLRVRARLNEIQRSGQPEEEPSEKQKPTLLTKVESSPEGSQSVFHPSPGMELDLRGQRAEDALLVLERYIDQAYLAGMPFVRIIHGKGTGRLRQVVREALHQSPHIQRFANGMDNEGGEGVTVAHLNND